MTAKQFNRNRILSQIHKYGKRRGLPSNLHVDAFMREHVAQLLAVYSDNDCVLIGASSLLARIPNVRQTRDIDLVTTRKVDAFIEDWVEKVNRSTWTPFTFSIEPKKPIRGVADGRSFSIAVSINDEFLARVKLDVSHRELQDPELVRGQSLDVPFLSARGNIVYPVVSMVDYISDKVEALFTEYRDKDGNRVFNHRWHDLADIALVSQHLVLTDQPVIAEIISRLAHHPAFRLPSSFEQPDETYTEENWAFMAKRRHIPSELTLSVALKSASLFLNPLMGYAVKGVVPRQPHFWVPTAGQWESDSTFTTADSVFPFLAGDS